MAHFESEKPVQRQDISRLHGIPADYLDQILSNLGREDSYYQLEVEVVVTA